MELNCRLQLLNKVPSVLKVNVREDTTISLIRSQSTRNWISFVFFHCLTLYRTFERSRPIADDDGACNYSHSHDCYDDAIQVTTALEEMFHYLSWTRHQRWNYLLHHMRRSNTINCIEFINDLTLHGTFKGRSYLSVITSFYSLKDPLLRQ